MEIIMDEVKNNGADLNMRTLSHHMIYLIGQHGELYREVVARLNPDQLLQVFDMMKIENFGRAMTFLKKLLSLQNALYKAPPSLMAKTYTFLEQNVVSLVCIN